MQVMFGQVGTESEHLKNLIVAMSRTHYSPGTSSRKPTAAFGSHYKARVGFEKKTGPQFPFQFLLNFLLVYSEKKKSRHLWPFKAFFNWAWRKVKVLSRP